MFPSDCTYKTLATYSKVSPPPLENVNSVQKEILYRSELSHQRLVEDVLNSDSNDAGVCKIVQQIDLTQPDFKLILKIIIIIVVVTIVVVGFSMKVKPFLIDLNAVLTPGYV